MQVAEIVFQALALPEWSLTLVLVLLGLGLPVALVGVIVLSTLGPRILPDRTPEVDPGARARTFQIAMRVADDSPLVDRTVADAGLRDLEGAFLAFVERVDDGGAPHVVPAAPNTVLAAGDLCCFVGESDRVLELHDGRFADDSDAALDR